MIHDRNRPAAAPLCVGEAVTEEERLTTSFRAEAQVHALKALETLAWLSQNAASEAVRVSAANAVLDRAHGKPASGAWAARVRHEDEGDGDELEVRWLGARS